MSGLNPEEAERGARHRKQVLARVFRHDSLGTRFLAKMFGPGARSLYQGP